MPPQLTKLLGKGEHQKRHESMNIQRVISSCVRQKALPRIPEFRCYVIQHHMAGPISSLPGELEGSFLDAAH